MATTSLNSLYSSYYSNLYSNKYISAGNKTGINPYNYLSLLNGSGANTTKNDQLFSALKLVYQTTSQLKADQTAFRQQIKGFNADARSLSSTGFSMKYLTADTDTKEALSTVKSTLGAYNGLTSSLGEAKNLTTTGSNLLGKLQETMASRSDDLKTVGITQDEESGEWTVDEKKFTQAMTETPEKAAGILGGKKGLGSELAATAQSVLSTPTADYFKAPAAANNSQVLKSFFSSGLLLDMSV
jgi:hypothetical protein